MSTSEEKTSNPSIDTKEETDKVWDDKVMPAIQDAVAIAWDWCHKIYVLKDNEQLLNMRKLGYPQIVERDTELPTEEADAVLLEIIKDWFSRSCDLRFIEAITTVTEGDPNDRMFEDLIRQFDPNFLR